MVRMRLLLALVAALAAFALAGCGGEETTATSDAGTATLAPRDAGVWASIDTDRASSQWQALTALLERVPGADAALDDLLAKAVAEDGLDWQDDVLPALGPEVVLVVPGGSDEALVLTQPRDEAKLEALAQREQGTVVGEQDGWTVVAESQAALDAYQAALEDGSLADDAGFEDAVAGLPEEALARLYVDGAGLEGALARGAAQAGSALPGGAVVTGPLAGSTAGLGTVSAAITAEEDGLRLVALAAPETGALETFEPTLLDRVPADALLAVAFRGGEAVRSQLDQAGGGALGPQLEQALGLSLDDLAGLFDGEGVLYVRPGAPIPEVTLALDGAGERGVEALGRLVRGFGALLPGAAAGPALQTETEHGVRVTRFELQQGVAIRWASVDGTLLVTTGAGGIRSFRAGGGAKLVDSAAFEQAAADVGFTGETSGFAYADVDALVPLLEGLADMSGSTPDASFADVAAALEAIDGLALDARPDGERVRVEGFLRIR
jgi:hypothetical protein